MAIFDGIKKFFSRTAGAEAEQDPDGQDQPSEEDQDDPQLETDDQVVTHVEKLYREWYDARMPFEPVWYQNYAHYLGFQYHTWDNIGRQLTEGRAPSYRVRMVINMIMPAVKTYVGKFMRGDPVFRARPGEPSDMAYADARVSDRVLRATWRALDGTDEELEFLHNVIIYGNAFWENGWDPALGKRVEFPGFPAVQTGDAVWNVLGPFPILVPPETKTLTKPTQLIDARIFPLRWMRQQYGARVNGIKPDGDLSSMSSYEHRISQLVSPQVAYGSGQGGKYVQAVMRKAWWSDPETLSERERAKYPDGRLIVVGGGKLLYKDNNPFHKLGKHPFVHCKGEIAPGRFWGASILDQVAPMQKSYNRGRSQLKEVANLCANPVLDVEQGHGITAHTAEPGAIAARKKGWAAPQYRATPPMNQHQLETVRLDKQDFDEVIQIRQASKGEVQGAGIVSGVALELAQEADNNPLTGLALRIARAFSRVMTGTLKIIQEYYTEDRLLEVTGEGQETEIFMFRADKHRTEMRVECLVSSIIPASSAARFSRVETATRLGYLDPVKDRAMGLRMLQFGDDDQIFEQADHDRQLQMREMMKLEQGMPVPVAPWHDDEVHLLTMRPKMLSAEWESWPPEIQQAWLDHYNAHLDQLAAKTQPPPAQSAPALGREPAEPDLPAIAGGLGALTQGGEV